jgi:hypothetical protein
MLPPRHHLHHPQAVSVLKGLNAREAEVIGTRIRIRRKTGVVPADGLPVGRAAPAAVILAVTGTAVICSRGCLRRSARRSVKHSRRLGRILR